MTGPRAPMRLPPQPGEMIDRGRPVEFTWNGRKVHGYAGDTIVSALAAAGERVFSRSLKYHRPRGVLTASFHDPGCMVQVGDEPNVRAAHRLVSGGMAVTSQNTWPSLRFDARAVNRFAGRFLTAGFYYKTFMRPRFLWPAYESALRRFVNGGRVSPDTAPIHPAKRYAHPDVLECAVIGVPHEKWGEAIRAVIARRNGSDLTEEALIAWCRERMTHFKCPTSVVFVESLPKGGTGKVQKNVLRQRFG